MLQAGLPVSAFEANMVCKGKKEYDYVGGGLLTNAFADDKIFAQWTPLQHGELAGFSMTRSQSPPPAHQQQVSPITPVNSIQRSYFVLTQGI